MTETIRVVVVDDSPFICHLLTSYLQSSPEIQVVGTALNGTQGVNLVKELSPDAVTLDMEMPEMNGLHALKQIMSECPTPVVLISGVCRQAASVALKALDMGAVDFILKYTPGVNTDPEILRQEIIAKLKAAAQIKVIRSIRISSHHGIETRAPTSSAQLLQDRDYAEPKLEQVRKDDIGLKELLGVIVIGASTGGPLAIRELLGHLPSDFPYAVIIVQHIPAPFTKVLATQLNQQVPLRVKEAESADRLVPGMVFVAPGDYHLLVNADLTISLSDGPEIDGHRPSIDVTMQSVAQHFGARTKGVLLTGMGRDGSHGLVSIHAKGGKTFVQDGSSCVVDGMPKRAIEKGIVDHIASPDQIAHLLCIGYTPSPERSKQGETDTINQFAPIDTL